MGVKWEAHGLFAVQVAVADFLICVCVYVCLEAPSYSRIGRMPDCTPRVKLRRASVVIVLANYQFKNEQFSIMSCIKCDFISSSGTERSEQWIQFASSVFPFYFYLFFINCLFTTHCDLLSPRLRIYRHT